MATRDLIGYWDTSTAHGDYRIEVIPPSAFNLTPTVIPAFGDEPGVGSNYWRLPDRALALVQADPTGEGSAIVAGEAKFGSGFPWGMAEPPSFTLQAFPGAMQSTVTDQEFADFIIDHVYEDQGTITRPEGGNDTFDLGTRIIVRKGTTGALVADFDVRFDGVLRTVPTQKWTITPGDGAVVDLEMDHIAKYVLDTVKLSWVCGRALATTYTTDFPTAPDSPDKGDSTTGYERVYDAVWGSTTNTYAWMFEPVDQRVVGYHRAHLMLAAQWACNWVYSQLVRKDPSTTNFRFSSANYGSAEGYNATPWDHWTLYEQSDSLTTYAPASCSANIANQRGDAFAARWVTFIGTVALDSAPTDYVAGLLIDGDQSLYQYPTLWDFLVEACDDGGCKGIITTPADRECEVVFRALTEVSSTTTLTIESFRSKADPSSFADAFDMEVGAAAVVAVDATVKQSFGDDNGNYNTHEGARTEGGTNVKCIWDTMPTVGTDSWKMEESSEDWPSATLFLGANRREWPFWKLYYSTTIFASAQRVMIRVHDSVRIDDGGGTPVDYGAAELMPIWSTGAYYGLPTPTLGGFATSFTTQQAWDGFILPARKAWLTRQRLSSSHFAIANHIMARFGLSRKPVTIRATIPASLVSMDQLGDRFRVGPTPYVASNLLNTGDTYLDGLSADGDLTSVRIDDVTGLADIEIVTGDTTS